MATQPEAQTMGKDQQAGNGPLDGFTVCDDAESLYSGSDTSTESDLPERWQIESPVFHLDKRDGQKPVYEAWRIHRPLDAGGETSAYRLLGAKVWEGKYLNIPQTKCSPISLEQSQMAEIHLQALEKFQAKHHRGWASRIVNKGKTYEQDIDRRCSSLPPNIQQALCYLLARRSDACSTKYRGRVWSVVALEERQRRFAEDNEVELKRHKFRFWKNPDPAISSMVGYVVVIRGTEVKTSEKGFNRHDDLGNPWLHIDQQEHRHKAREGQNRREERRRRYRSPPSYRDLRGHSPMSDSESDRGRSSFPPSYRTRRNYSPVSEPETEARARRYIHITRAGRAVPPMVPMAPPPAFGEPYPSPPRTPSPVSDFRSYRDDVPFQRPRVPYVEEDGPWNTVYDDEVAPPPAPPMIRPSVTIYAPQHFGIRAANSGNGFDGPPEVIPDPPEPCIACNTVPDCGHFNRSTSCERPVSWYGDSATHPPCFICMATSPDGPHGFDPSRPYSRVPRRTTEGREQSVVSAHETSRQGLGSECVCDSGSFLEPVHPATSWTSAPSPPQYPGRRQWSGRNADEEAYAPTEIETDDDKSDDERSDDGERTAVEDAPEKAEQ